MVFLVLLYMAAGSWGSLVIARVLQEPACI